VEGFCIYLLVSCVFFYADGRFLYDLILALGNLERIRSVVAGIFCAIKVFH
jgi:hypothetical protein